jgi:RNA polymerase sigma-70 factor (ECF subfamily)
MDMNDQEIISLYFDRDEQAIKETDTKYGKTCMQVSMNILHSHPDAEECVNDTYLKTWDSIPPARPASLCAFVCRIVRNLSLNRLKELTAAKRSRDLTVSFEELEDCIPMPDGESPVLAEELAAFLKTEGEVDRVLFVGRYWFACSVEELARRTGLTKRAVHMRIFRTRERLRAYLVERGYSV